MYLKADLGEEKKCLAATFRPCMWPTTCQPTLDLLQLQAAVHITQAKSTQVPSLNREEVCHAKIFCPKQTYLHTGLCLQV